MALHEPVSHSSLASLLAEHPDALLLAGGTELMRGLRGADVEEERTVISLRGMESMMRISRSQRYIDIGSMVTLSRILSIGPNVIPESLFAALKSIASPSVRLLATLGGNLCAPDTEHTALAPLALLEAQLELRSGAASRLVPASEFWAGGRARDLGPAEVLTRVRLPLGESDTEVFARSSTATAGGSLPVAFCASALINKGALDALRVAVSCPPIGVRRLDAVESTGGGARLPLRDRAVDELEAVARGELGELHQQLDGADQMLLRLLRWFLKGLARRSGEGAQRALQRPGGAAILP